MPGGSPGEVLAFFVFFVALSARPTFFLPVPRTLRKASIDFLEVVLASIVTYAAPGVAAELDLADRVAGGLEGELQQPQDRRRRVEVGVGVRPRRLQRRLRSPNSG